MSPLFWIVMVYIATNVSYQWYLVDRPRTKTATEAFFATLELAVLGIAIYALAN